MAQLGELEEVMAQMQDYCCSEDRQKVLVLIEGESMKLLEMRVYS